MEATLYLISHLSCPHECHYHEICIVWEHEGRDNSYGHHGYMTHHALRRSTKKILEKTILKKKIKIVFEKLNLITHLPNDLILVTLDYV